MAAYITQMLFFDICNTNITCTSFVYVFQLSLCDRNQIHFHY